MTRRLFICLVAVFGVLAVESAAVEPDEALDDPALEMRALEISRNLRCVVCQSQSIDDSNAPLAKDMRLLVRERLVAGDSDNEVYDYLVARYGDYVLLRPPVQQNTYVLWLAPLLVFASAVMGAGFYFRQVHRKSAKAPKETQTGSMIE